jgi:hypothetical protein
VVFNKSGQWITSIPSSSIFGFATGGDGHVIYDEITGRYAYEVLKSLNANGVGSVAFAVSDTSDPTGSWHSTTINVNGLWDGYAGNGIGYNADAYVVHVNGFNNQFAVIMYNNNPNLAYGMVSAPAGMRIGRPCPMAGSSPGGPFYFVEANGDGYNGTGGTAGNLEIVQVNNIVSNDTRTFNDYQISAFGSTGFTVMNVSWRNNQLATIGPDGGSVIHWCQVNTANMTLSQAGTFGTPNGGTPDLTSIAVAPNGSLGVNYVSITGSSMNTYVTGRTPSDTANAMESPVLASAGPASNGRIGDYCSCVVDINTGGVAQNSFWACNESMNSNNQFDWTTKLDKFSVAHGGPDQGVYYIGSYGDSGTALQGTLEQYYNGSSYVSGCNEVAVTPYSRYSYQQWTVTPIGSGQYHVLNNSTGLSLQATGDPYNNGHGIVGGADKIALTPSFWNISQQAWLFNPASQGYSLANPANSQNLQASQDSYKGLSGCYQVLGSPYSWGVGANQEWNLVP